MLWKERTYIPYGEKGSRRDYSFLTIDTRVTFGPNEPIIIMLVSASERTPKNVEFQDNWLGSVGPCSTPYAAYEMCIFSPWKIPSLSANTGDDCRPVTLWIGRACMVVSTYEHSWKQRLRWLRDSVLLRRLSTARMSVHTGLGWRDVLFSRAWMLETRFCEEWFGQSTSEVLLSHFHFFVIVRKPPLSSKIYSLNFLSTCKLLL